MRLKYIKHDKDLTKKTVAVVGKLFAEHSRLNWFLLKDKKSAIQALKEHSTENKPQYIVYFGKHRLFKLSVWPHKPNKRTI